MKYCKTPQKQRLFFVFIVVCFCLFMLVGRLVYLMIYRADYYGERAKAVQQRERSIKGSRGKILDRNGIVLAGNKSVSTISVIHNQIKQPETSGGVMAKAITPHPQLVNTLSSSD